MSSCTQPVPYQFQIGGTCAGHGICVNSTRTPGLLLCKCDSWYSGASDFFDNRVEQLPDGTWLSFSCNSSDVGTYVVWGLFVLCGVLRCIQLIPLWRSFYKKHYEDEKKAAGGIWNDGPFRIVTVDLFGVGIPFLVTGFAKLGGMTLGTDALVTVFLLIFVGFFQLTSYDLGKLEFDIFVQGSSHHDEAEKAKRLRIMLKLGGTMANLTLVSGVTLWTLGTDKSKGPLLYGGNGEEFAVYSRNIGAIIYVLCELASSLMIRKRVQMLRLVGGGKEDSAVTYIIKKMDSELKSFLGRLLALGSLYIVFSIPFLLPYQTYALGIIMGLGLSKPLAKAFATESEKRRATVGTPSNTTSKLESGGKAESGERGPMSVSPISGSTRTLGGVKRESSLLNPPCQNTKRGSVPSMSVPLSQQEKRLSIGSAWAAPTPDIPPLTTLAPEVVVTPAVATLDGTADAPQDAQHSNLGQTALPEDVLQ